MTNNKPNDVLLPCPFCNGDAGVPNHADDCYFTLSAQLKESSASDLSLVPDVLRAWNRRAILAQPADQQCEPIGYAAWNTGTNPGTRLMRYDGMVLVNPEQGGIYQIPVYRHAQPATAKVVLPERMIVPGADCPERVNAQGWNACLDEVAKLNGVVADGKARDA